MARVFVSHASEDRELANEVFGWLTTAGHEAFFDVDLLAGISVGDRWEDRLLERLRWADAVACVVTSAFVSSAWCSAEVAIAVSRGVQVLPVMLDPDVEHPLLDRFQHVSCIEDPVRARQWLEEALRRLDLAGGRGWADGRNPFPGLRSFDAELRSVFFGRDQDVKDLVKLLRSACDPGGRGLILVTGPSGCGKSSMVRAGLVPRVASESDWWVLPAVLPGEDPVESLALEITAAALSLGLSWELPSVRSRIEGGGIRRVVDELLLATPGFGQGRRLLIVIDQFEELFSLATPPARGQFVGLLRDAISGRVRVVATLRADYWATLQASPDMACVPIYTFPLRPLSREALPLVINGPAERAGIGIDPELVTRLVTDTDTGDALPLLAFTLQQLASDLTRGGHLSISQYDRIGGVRGALTFHAEAALTAAMAGSGRTGEQVIDGLLRLVTVDELGRPARARIRLEDVSASRRAELNEFITRRLLMADADGHSVYIGAAHEAFLSDWQPLARAVATHGVALRTQHAVEEAAIDWEWRGFPKGRLWDGGQLATALYGIAVHPSHRGRSASLNGSRRLWSVRRKLLPETLVELSPRATAFLKQSVRAERRRRRGATTKLSILLGVAGLLLIVAVLAGISAVDQTQVAEQAEKVAVASRLLAEAETVRATDPRTAEKMAIAANALYPDGSTEAAMANNVIDSHLVSSLTGHMSGVVSVAFSPDGHTMASGSWDHTGILWNITDPSLPARIGQPLTGHTGAVWSVAFSPDGHILATASNDRTVILWDITDLTHPTPIGQPLTGHTGAVRSVAFSPDGHTLATASADQTVILWDITDTIHPTPIGQPLPGHSDGVQWAGFSPDGNTLATASADQTVILWDITDPTHPTPIGQPLTGHSDGVQWGAFSPDGHTLATASKDQTVILWDITDPTHPTPIGQPLTGHTGVVRSVAFSPDGHTLATASADKTVILWDITDPSHPARTGQPLTGHTWQVASVAFSGDGNTIATASGDWTVILWNTSDPSRPARIGQPLTGHTDIVWSVAFSPDGHILATASADQTVILWDITDPTHPTPNGQPLTGHTDAVLSLAFSPDGHTLATASADQTVILWDITDPTHPTPIGQPLTGHSDGVPWAAFSPDGHTLATAGADQTVILWDITDPTHPTPIGQPLTGHTGIVWTVAFSPDGHTLATASADQTVILWDITDPTHPTLIGQPLTGHSDEVQWAGFSPDGHTLATASADKTVILWDITDPTYPTPIGQPLTGHSDGVMWAAFSPDGHTLATASKDKTVILWDITDPSRPAQIGQPLTGHTGQVTSVVFSPGGRALADSSSDGGVIRWDLTGIRGLRENQITRACLIAGGGLTPDEWARYITEFAYQKTCAN